MSGKFWKPSKAPEWELHRISVLDSLVKTYTNQWGKIGIMHDPACGDGSIPMFFRHESEAPISEVTASDITSDRIRKDFPPTQYKGDQEAWKVDYTNVDFILCLGLLHTLPVSRQHELFLRFNGRPVLLDTHIIDRKDSRHHVELIGPFEGQIKQATTSGQFGDSLVHTRASLGRLLAIYNYITIAETYTRPDRTVMLLVHGDQLYA